MSERCLRSRRHASPIEADLRPGHVRLVCSLPNALPSCHQFVVGLCVFGPAIALAQVVGAVGEGAHGLGALWHAGQQAADRDFAVLVEGADQLFRDSRTGVRASCSGAQSLAKLDQRSKRKLPALLAVLIWVRMTYCLRSTSR